MADTDIGSPDPATTFAAEPGDVAAGPAAGLTPGAGIWRRRRGWLIVAVPAAVSFVLGGYQIGGAFALAGRGVYQGRDRTPVRPDLRPARPPGRGARRLLPAHARGRGGARHLRHRAAVPLAVRHGHRDRVRRGHRPPGGRPGAGPGRRAERSRAGRPRADRAALRPAVRHRAVHDLLRADGQVVRDRDDVRRDRLLPAAAGVARRPLAVVAGVRRGGGADRPVQHLRAADRGRARDHAAAHGRPRPDRARTPDRPRSRCAGWPRAGPR